MGDRENGSRATIVRPRPLDLSKSAMENVLELTALKDLGPVRPTSHPTTPLSPPNPFHLSNQY
jgi:hypothetical protein